MISNNLFHPFATTGATDRLKEEFDTYGKLVIGFDFDNTIFDFPSTLTQIGSKIINVSINNT